MITVFMAINRFILTFSIQPLLHFISLSGPSLSNSHLLFKVPIEYRFFLKLSDITGTVTRQRLTYSECLFFYPLMLGSNPSLFLLKQLNKFLDIFSIIEIILDVILLTFLTINIFMLLTHHVFYNSFYVC